MRRFAKKAKRSLCYLIENSTKSLCQPYHSDDLSFLEFPDFCLFCASFSDNLVTAKSFSSLAHVSVTSSTIPANTRARFCPKIPGGDSSGFRINCVEV
jgi:hypothetical protein